MVSPRSSPKSPRINGPKSPRTPGLDSSEAFAIPNPALPSIEAADDDDPGEEDEFDTDEYDARSDGTISITSSVYAHTYEHGRRYQYFKNSRYPIPNDDREQDREDMKHAMLMELTDGKLFYAPVGDHPQLIVDVGTGTGEYGTVPLQAGILTMARDRNLGNRRYVCLTGQRSSPSLISSPAGDAYPSARVRGIDVSPIQPVWVPSNVDFIVDDCEAHDDLGFENVDLVHFRFMAMVLRKMPIALRNAYESLRDGGWIEMQELLGVPLCDDGTMAPDDPVKQVYDLAGEAFTKIGLNVRMAADLESFLLDAGFVNVQCLVKKVPIGPWAKDKTLRVIGYYQKLAVEDLLPAMAGRPFTVLGLSPTESQVYLAKARHGLEDMTVHRYFNYYFWTAQKVEAA